MMRAKMGGARPINENELSFLATFHLRFLKAVAKSKETDRVKADDTLFVFAKAVSGPPMPIAAIRRQAGELPLQLVLDDSTVLASGGKLIDHAQLKIAARITSGGQPTAKSGDLQSGELVFTPGEDTALELRIDQVVP